MTDPKKQIHNILSQEQKVHKVQEPQLLENFNQHLSLTLDTTNSHHHWRNLNNIKILMRELPELEWQDLGEKDVQQILVAIQDRDVKESSKNKYRESLKKYLEMQDKKWSEYTPEGVTVYKRRNDEELTDPEKIPNPEEVKRFLQEVEARSHEKTRLRNLAFFFTLWDTGARCNGLKKSPLDYEIHEKYVTVTIYPTKKSPERKVDCAFAAPVLKKYIDNHPDPDSGYLFPRVFHNRQVKSQSSYEKDHINDDSIRKLAKNIWKDLEESDVVNVEWRQQPLHIFRKSMKTWFNNMEIQNETDIDVRAGHVIGSDYTRTYTRKSDEDSNRAMRENLGIEEGEEKDWRSVLWPKNCDSCGELNSGHRDVCYSCQSSLTEKAYGYGIEEQVQEKAKKRELIGKIKELENLKRELELEQPE